MDERENTLGLVSWVTVLRSRGFLWVMIPLLWAAAYLPVLGVRDLRLEEGRRATPAAEMLRSGNFVVPTLYGERYLSKPPLFFWVAAGMGKLQGRVNELSVRIPSVVSVLLGAWLLVGFGGVRREVRVLAALVFMSLPVMLDKGTLGEIDALLSLVTFAAVAVWWRFYDAERGRVGMWGWIGAGILLGLSVLMKGPGGVAEFYAVVVGFVMFAGRGRWKVLFSLGHLVMLVLAAGPICWWVAALLKETGMGWRELAGIWVNQTGVDVVAGGRADWGKLVVDHYVMFPLRVFADLLPWSLVGVVGRMRGRPEARSQKPEEKEGRDLWVLAAAGWVVLLVVFWIWPKGNPRYMMMGAYPMSFAAAMAIGRWELAGRVKLAGFLRSAGVVAAWCIGMVGGATIMLGIMLNPGGMMVTYIVVAVSFVVAVWAMWLTKRTPLEGAAVACAGNFAILILLAWGMLMTVFLPVKAKTDATRMVHQQMERIVPAGVPVYTTRIFSKNVDCYNEQFYLPGGAKGIGDFSQLPAGAKVTVILSPSEWDALLEKAPDARELGRLDALLVDPKKKGAPGALVVAEVFRK